MEINTRLALLGKMSPQEFMRSHWQKKPLIVRGALSQEQLALLPRRKQLFEYAKRETVSSRLIQKNKNQFTLKHQPKVLPALKNSDWTLLVQGVDLIDTNVSALLQQFRFIPDTRLDDAMFSFATLGGGVGAHFDSYDVFLLQTSGQRRWRYGRQKNLTLVENAPLKILQQFQPSKTIVLSAGDMLYLPPRYAHEGVALAAVADAHASQSDGNKHKESSAPSNNQSNSDCITCSIGFRAPSAHELGRELLERLSEDIAERPAATQLYSDKDQTATDTPARIPDALQTFARKALALALGNHRDLAIHLGEYLTEPHAAIIFSPPKTTVAWKKIQNLKLDAATRMMFDQHHIFINGESFLASGADAKLMRQLANARQLRGKDIKLASSAARELLQDWLEAGWCHA